MTNPSTRTPVAVVADDEDLGRLLLAESAGAAGLQAVAVDNGIDALQAALRENVGLVLLDVDMPGLDGFEVCRRIRAARGAALPVVMVTGLDDKTAIDRAFEAGATDFISKPVNWTLLPHRLAYIVRNSEREARIVTLVDAIPDALWVVSADGEPRWSKTDGATLQPADRDAKSKPLVESVPRERLAELLSGIAATARDGSVRTLDVRHEAPDASLRFSEIRLSRVEGGDVLVVMQDTTDRALSAARIERLAFFDGLTGLPNRQHCLERTSRFLERASQEGEGLALLYIDLNSFKRINDTFGHSVGDVILQKVGTVLSTLLEEQCKSDAAFLARLGGDEFVVVVQEKDARAAATRTAEEIRNALSVPIRHGTLEFIAAPSIGTAAFPEDGTDLETLLRHADTAMYQAKAAGGPKIIAYQPVMSARLRDALELENHLRKALRDDALDIRFQPKFRLKDGALVGAEALVRWFDADFGEISPNRFVPVAEESGLIVDMGAWIMRAVCQRLGKWYQAGIAIPIAVNVSGKELLFADPSKLIKAEADLAGIPTGLIEAEITESVFVTDLTVARSSVNKIRDLGCRIALDDFGTGYSSLSYLTRFPPDRLKIDRSFISNVDRSQNDGAIVKAIMSLARSLNLLVTAEGIETQGQLDWLRSQGCDEVQGYLLARPLSATEMESRFLRPEAQMVAARMAR